MLSRLLVAGAASGEFLTPIKSHHHQESLNLKESSDNGSDSKKARLDDPLGALYPRTNCDKCDTTTLRLGRRAIANWKERKEANARLRENQRELKEVLIQQAADEEATRELGDKQKATRKKTKALKRALELGDPDDPDFVDLYPKIQTEVGVGGFPIQREKLKATRQRTRNKAGKSEDIPFFGMPEDQKIKTEVGVDPLDGRGSIVGDPLDGRGSIVGDPLDSGSMFSDPLDGSGSIVGESSSRGSMFSDSFGGASRFGESSSGGSMLSDPLDGSGSIVGGGVLGSSSGNNSTWDPTERFGFGRSSTVTSGAIDGGGSIFGDKPDCERNVKTEYDCYCKTSSGTVNLCYSGMTCESTGNCRN